MTWRLDRMLVHEVVEWFESIYGNVGVSCGYHHGYLGMDLHFSCKKQLRVSMVKSLKKMITKWPEEIFESAVTPTTDELFEVRADNDPNTSFLMNQGPMHSIIQLLGYYLSQQAKATTWEL